MCLFSNRESSELVGMTYDSRDMFKNAAINALFVFNRDFLAQFIGMTSLLLKCSQKLD